jgi:hypothetical protein
MTGGGYLRTMPHERCAQAVRGSSIVAAVVACVATIALVAPTAARADRPACAEAVLDDWTRGTLDSHYSPECYQAAIDALPEDLRAYTTAADDIGRAAIAASRRTNGNAPRTELAARRLASESADADPLRSFPTEVVVLGAVLAALVSCGAAAALLRWRRGQ